MNWWSGYPGESEAGRKYMRSVMQQMPFTLRDVYRDIPDMVDPWSLSEKLLPTEDQGQIGSCSPGETRVTLADGTRPFISEVRIGDSVSLLDDQEGLVVDTRMHQYTGKLVHLELENGEMLCSDPDHMYGLHATGGEIRWKKSDFIKENDVIVGPNYSKVHVVSRHTSQVENLPLYSLTIQEAAEYFTDGVLSSNCQGQSLTECLEYCYYVATGEVLAFSRMFAYLASQKADNIRGDQGSTLSGGTRALRDWGCCIEDLCPYPSSYPSGGLSYISREAWENALKFRMKSAIEYRDEDEMKAFVGSGSGLIQIGIKWWSGFKPDQNGCIRQFSPPSSGFGGHAVVGMFGYVPDDIVKQKSSKGYWGILKNSHSTRWGVRGRAYVDPAVYGQMARDNFTVMVGRTDLDIPDVRPLPPDFTNPKQGSIA